MNGDPMYRFIGKFVEGSDRQLEMLFFRVLDLVVANAVEALHEHRDGGDARARHFGGDSDPNCSKMFTPRARGRFPSLLPKTR
ncbi:MAG: hypothetical protein QOD12_2314 [Verrucomicrobiota bacterium]